MMPVGAVAPESATIDTTPAEDLEYALSVFRQALQDVPRVELPLTGPRWPHLLLCSQELTCVLGHLLRDAPGACSRMSSLF